MGYLKLLVSVCNIRLTQTNCILVSIIVLVLVSTFSCWVFYFLSQPERVASQHQLLFRWLMEKGTPAADSMMIVPKVGKERDIVDRTFQRYGKILIIETI
jgi:hypothetical protein